MTSWGPLTAQRNVAPDRRITLLDLFDALIPNRL
jgi:hypothetical protein